AVLQRVLQEERAVGGAVLAHRGGPVVQRVQLHPGGDRVVAGGVQQRPPGVHVGLAAELQPTALLAGCPRRPVDQRRVGRVLPACFVGGGRAGALAERVVVDTGQAGRARRRIVAVTGAVRARDDLLVDLACL